MIAGTLLIRADASVAIGTGHVMRCIALAQAWQDAGGRAVFAMAEATPAVRARIAAEACEIAEISSSSGTAEDAIQTIALAEQKNCEWIVVDGYHFGADYQRALKAAGFKLTVLDDYGHAQHYCADFVLNQNVSASKLLYESRDEKTQLLLGPRYCLLRREFLKWRDWRREIAPKGHRVLVTMGGSDPANVTARVMDALSLVKINDLEAIVVIGGSNPYADSMQLSDRVDKKISLRRDVTNMAELMAWADVAVSSAGTTCWELCLLALPSLLIDVAENQSALARELGRLRYAIHLGAPSELSTEQIAGQVEKLLGSEEMRRSLSIRYRELVDGLGAQRVVAAMRANLRLHLAREDDCRLLWEWANDPQVRANAFSSEPIPWEQHKVWFAGKMKDPNCQILIAEDCEDRPVGQFRVDWRSDQEGDISVSVASEFRGTGNGSVLIDSGSNRAFVEKGARLHAYVKVENQASKRAFERAGFATLGEEIVRGHRAVHYVRTRTEQERGPVNDLPEQRCRMRSDRSV
jgi:UDP-2,4-diacetamido-2,4,6-trideoxy-beta-L-altropyranose hydrolase